MLNQKGFFPLVIFLGILILGISFGVGYLLITNKLSDSPPPVTDVDNISNYTPPPCYSKSDPNSASPLRAIDINSKFLGNQDYPAEIKNICDSELVGMDCLEPYTRRDDGMYVYNNTETTESGIKSVSLIATQEDVLDNISRLTRKLDNKNPNKVKFCSIGKGNLITEYELWQVGKEKEKDKDKDKNKDKNKTVGFALLYAQGGVNNLATIPNGGLANFTCDKQILFTKDNNLYVECEGGNEISVSKFIYKININEGISTKIFQCSSTGTNIRGEDNVVCESALTFP